MALSLSQSCPEHLGPLSVSLSLSLSLSLSFSLSRALSLPPLTFILLPLFPFTLYELVNAYVQ